MRLTAITLALSLTGLAAACHRAPPAPVPAVAKAVAVTPADAPAAVADYLAALASVEKSTTPTSLEPLFDKAEAAQTALMEVAGEKAVLERYTDAEFTALQMQVRGLKLHRALDIYAQPEPAFFLNLAEGHGTPADVAFFTQYAATWGADLVPTYLKLRPQPTPCVRFGDNRIVPLYAAWQGYAIKHPEAFKARVQQNIGDLEEAVALGTCACDGVASVQREQAEFLKLFPNNVKAAEINARAEQLVKDPDVLPVNCR